jgi:hypothetical protein
MPLIVLLTPIGAYMSTNPMKGKKEENNIIKMRDWLKNYAILPAIS